MLQAYARWSELTEDSLSPSGLTRVWIFMFGSLPILTDLVLSVMGMNVAFIGGGSIASKVIWLASGACLIGFVASRLVNRFWARDRYLDEWEVTLKRESMTFAFQLTLYLLSALFVGLIVFGSAYGSGVTKPYAVPLIAGIVIAGLYVQTAYVLLRTRPVEAEDGVAAGGSALRALRPSRLLIAVLAIMAVVLALITVANVARFNQFSAVADTAKANCEARGSSVKSVRTDIIQGSSATCQDGSDALSPEG